MKLAVPFGISGQLTIIWPNLKCVSALPDVVFIDPYSYELLSDLNKKLTVYYVVRPEDCPSTWEQVYSLSEEVKEYVKSALQHKKSDGDCITRISDFQTRRSK